MAEILDKLRGADVIVLTSYLITLGGVPDKKLMANILSDFNMYVGCFSEFNPMPI